MSKRIIITENQFKTIVEHSLFKEPSNEELQQLEIKYDNIDYKAGTYFRLGVDYALEYIKKNGLSDLDIQELDKKWEI